MKIKPFTLNFAWIPFVQELTKKSERTWIVKSLKEMAK